ncbi:hypothetical protein N9R99_02285 [Gammaproteobacteria bacterium]|jgi:hypothetical protein|nr:hypothetical protein [Gammaproteobacteria bacterium]
MKIIEELKKAMNWEELDEATAKDIIKDLEDGIESLKEKQDLEEANRKAEEGLAWTKKVTEARQSRTNTIQRRKKEQQLKGFSAGRLAMLRRLGKLDD